MAYQDKRALGHGNGSSCIQTCRQFWGWQQRASQNWSQGWSYWCVDMINNGQQYQTMLTELTRCPDVSQTLVATFPSRNVWRRAQQGIEDVSMPCEWQIRWRELSQSWWHGRCLCSWPCRLSWKRTGSQAAPAAAASIAKASQRDDFGCAGGEGRWWTRALGAWKRPGQKTRLAMTRGEGAFESLGHRPVPFALGCSDLAVMMAFRSKILRTGRGFEGLVRWNALVPPLLW